MLPEIAELKRLSPRLKVLGRIAGAFAALILAGSLLGREYLGQSFFTWAFVFYLFFSLVALGIFFHFLLVYRRAERALRKKTDRGLL